MNEKYAYEVAVIGGGLAGLALSALLGTRGVRVLCIDSAPLATQKKASFDGRTTAISYGSQKLMAAAGLWEALEPQSCPIKTIQILDGDSPVLLDFDSAEVGDRIFGWIAENRFMRTVMQDRLADLPAVTYLPGTSAVSFDVQEDTARVHLSGNKTIKAALVVGADGRQSFTREVMNIGNRSWSYRQEALVFAVEHEKPHDNIAVEHFRKEGPFAILPMIDGANGAYRSSVVWTQHASGKEALAFPQDVFDAALNARFPDRYGAVRQIGRRYAFPLGLVHAHSYIAPRMALVADAAHGIHPIAGQGLNLGYRDIAALGELVSEAVAASRDPGSPALLEQYQRQRRFDNMAMAGTTDILNRLFSNDRLPLKIARRSGLHAVSKLPFMKRFFMKQAMGAAGILPGLIYDERETA